jgi:hypothetical protein
MIGYPCPMRCLVTAVRRAADVGATVASTPAGQVRYASGDSVVPDPIAAAVGENGVADVLDVPPGPTTVRATRSNGVVTSHVIDVRADVITATWLY